MAKEHSLDISAKIDKQSLKDAINLADKEVANRYDFKGTPYEINYKEHDKALVLIASSDNKLDALKDIVIAKLLKRGLSSNVLEELRVEDASGGTRKATFKVVDYIEAKEAKKIVAEIKNKQIDDLQKVMRAVKSMEWDAPLVYDNMR